MHRTINSEANIMPDSYKDKKARLDYHNIERMRQLLMKDR